MKKTLKILLLLFISLNILADDITVSDYIELAEEYVESEEYENATFVYQEALKFDENNIDILFKIAEIDVKLGKELEAESRFQRIIEINPNYDKAFLELAKIYDQKEDTKENNEKTMEYYKMYLKKNNYQDADVTFNLGNRYVEKFEYESAVDVFKKDKTNDYRNVYGTALMYRFLGYYPKSISYYEKLIELKPDYEEAFLGIAISYKLSYKLDKACENYEKYLEIKKDENVYNDLATLYMLQEKMTSAKRTVQKGLEFFSNSSQLRELLLEIYNKMGSE